MRDLHIILLMLLALPADGKVITVSNDGSADVSTIQAAIAAAENGDTVIIHPGTYQGPGNWNNHFQGKAISVRSIDPNDAAVVASTIIDGQLSAFGWNSAFVFDQNEGRDARLAGLTITQAQAGPAIRCEQSSPTLVNCVIRDNQVGGMKCIEGAPLLVDCVFRDNSIPEYREARGGAICAVMSRMDVRHCAFLNNATRTRTSVAQMKEMQQQHVNASTPLEISVSLGQGGAVYAEYAELSFSHCRFQGNVAAFGGGIFLAAYGGSLRRKAEFSNCLFAGNRAFFYGGVFLLRQAGPLHLGNCTLVANTAGVDGGALCGLATEQVTFVNTIIAQNSDHLGLGRSLYFDDAKGRQQSRLVWRSRGRSGQTLENHATSHYSCLQLNPDEENGPFTAAGSTIYGPPLFVTLPNHGGDGWGDDESTPAMDEGINDDYGDLRLQTGSPCIDSGSPETWIAPAAVDLAGLPRVMGMGIDMGVYEFLAPTLTVTRPQGSETWVAGSVQNVSWRSVGHEGAVEIQLSTNGGQTWQAIAQDVANKGHYAWHVPLLLNSSTCHIRVIPSSVGPNTVLMESGAFTVHPDLPLGSAIHSPWTSLGGDFARTGLSPFGGPEPGCVKWSFQAEGSIHSSITVGANDCIHVACTAGKLYTLNSSGELQWVYDADTPLLSSPTVGPDGTVYVGCADGTIKVISTQGELRWTFSTGEPIYSSPAVDQAGRVFFGSRNGVMYCLDSAGSELWQFKRGNPTSIVASPSIGLDGTVYIGFLYDPNLYAIDPQDGTIRWQCNFERGAGIYASPIVASDGTIYQTLLYDSRLHAIDPDQGAIVWSTDLTDPNAGLFDPDDAQNRPYTDGWSEPVTGPDGTIYVSLDDPYLRAVLPNGDMKWVTQLGELGGFALTVSDNGLVYAACDDGYLYTVGSNGAEISRLKLSGWPAYPVVLANDTLIICDAQDYSTFQAEVGNSVWAITTHCAEGQ